MRPLVASEEKTNAFFYLTEFMHFEFDYNLNFDNILAQNSNWVFKPIWQPYDALGLENSNKIWNNLIFSSFNACFVLL